jgi:hypothetical protein
VVAARDHGLRHVGHEGGDAIAFLQSRLHERLLHARDRLAQLAVREAPLHLVLAPEDDRISLGVSAQEVLGEVDPHVGEEARAGHHVALHQHSAATLAGDDSGEVPHRGPEFLEVVDGPLPERVVVGQLRAVTFTHLRGEASDVRIRDAFRGRRPERFSLHG